MLKILALTTLGVNSMLENHSAMFFFYTFRVPCAEMYFILIFTEGRRICSDPFYYSFTMPVWEQNDSAHRKLRHINTHPHIRKVCDVGNTMTSWMMTGCHSALLWAAPPSRCLFSNVATRIFYQTLITTLSKSWLTDLTFSSKIVQL